MGPVGGTEKRGEGIPECIQRQNNYMWGAIVSPRGERVRIVKKKG